MNAHAQPLRRKHSARIARALERAIPQPLLALPPLMLALGLLALAPLRINGDTWFGLVAGRDIVEHGLPHSDRLMALTAGHPWQDQQWLSHVTSYGLYQLGGLPLLSLVDIGCVIAALCIAIQASRRFGGTPLWITAAAGPLLMIQVPSEARAQSFVLPLFAALIWLLARDAREPRPADPAAGPDAGAVGEPARQHPDRVHARPAALCRRPRRRAAPSHVRAPSDATSPSRASRWSRRSRRPTARICSATTARR